jgi:sucrose-6-phosphate hydrolase SacC (GH32 family)
VSTIHQERTRTNIKFESPLKELLSFRITEEEYVQIMTVSKANEISSSELVRNLIREHIYEYAISENLRKKLRISNKIDAFLLEKRLILTRNDTSLAKIREILTDFEAFLESHPKRIDIVTAFDYKKGLDYLLKDIYEEDMWLANQIDTQYKRILKSKHFKALEPNV